MTGLTFEQAQRGYLNLWNRCTVSPAKLASAEAMAQRIIAHKSVYLAVENETGVPWFFCGLVHMRESNFNFGTHLHNGDPLTGYTFHKPPHRPQVGHGPPFTFSESAADALEMRGLQNIKEWPVARVLFELEAYNGWGYFLHGVNSPYLWSWTNLQQPGKYVADGEWSLTIDVQPGCAAVLKQLCTLGAVEFASSDQPQSIPVSQSVSLGPFPLEQSSRPFRYQGVITLDGTDYGYATGGLGRGSAPYGTFLITPDAIGPFGRRVGAIGVANGEIDDPKYPGQPRVGIEIHPGSNEVVDKLISEGCIVLRPSEYITFKKALLKDITQKGPQLINVHSDFHITITSRDTTSTQPAPSPALSHKPKEPPMSITIPTTLDLATIAQTVEHLEFVLPFVKMVFPQATLTAKLVEAILKAAASVQAAPNLDETTVAAAILPVLQQLIADVQALAPKPA